MRAAGPWDAILQLRGNDPEPRCLSYLLDPDVTVSVPNMTRLSWLCGHQVEQPDWDATHGVEQTLRIARYVGADTTEPHLVYAVREEERARLEEKLRRMLVGRQAAAGAATRRRPARVVARLAGGALRRIDPARAPRRIDAEIFVLGGEDQDERRRGTRRSFRRTGRSPIMTWWANFPLAESAALLASARALVSTDTGIMHLGFAVGTRVVAIIHCNNPASRVGPYGYGDRHRVVQLARPANYRTPADADMARHHGEAGFRRSCGRFGTP